MKGLVRFEWSVAEDGYRWEEATDGDWLLTTEAPLALAAARRYSPLDEHPALFRRFCAIGSAGPSEKAEIREFANQFGRLGGPDEQVFYSSQPPKLTGQVEGESFDLHHLGDRLSYWRAHLAAMREAVDMWDAVRARDETRLRTWIRWRSGEVRFHSAIRGGLLGDEDVGRVITSTKVHPERLEQLTRGDLLWPALYVLKERVNRRIAGLVSPRLEFAPNRVGLEDYMVPNSLIGGLWLQFFSAISRNAEYRKCQAVGCRQWFEVTPDTGRGGADSIEAGRRSRRFCSAACRARQHRAEAKKGGA